MPTSEQACAAARDLAARMRRANARAKAAGALLKWYETTHDECFGHDHHCPSLRLGEQAGSLEDCTCGWSAFVIAYERVSPSPGTGHS